MKIAEVVHIFGLLYSTVKFTYALLDTKKGWATFWAKFLQTHLVTLSPTYFAL
jgi:hypothetical protein